VVRRRREGGAGVIEVAGPAGSGKSTVSSVLTSRAEVLGASVWNLPRSLYAASAVRVLPAIANLVGATRLLLHEEIGLLIRLEALDTFLRRLPEESQRVVVLDEGPVFAFAWFRVVGHACFRDGRRDAWWRDVLAHWATRLDTIVLLDGADALLVDRLRARRKDHPLKGSSDEELYAFAEAYRRAFDWVVAAMTADGGPRVVTLESNGAPPEHIAERVLAACPPQEPVHAD
jgi:thymidylate kinase